MIVNYEDERLVDVTYVKELLRNQQKEIERSLYEPVDPKDTAISKAQAARLASLVEAYNEEFLKTSDEERISFLIEQIIPRIDFCGTIVVRFEYQDEYTIEIIVDLITETGIGTLVRIETAFWTIMKFKNQLFNVSQKYNEYYDGYHDKSMYIICPEATQFLKDMTDKIKKEIEKKVEEKYPETKVSIEIN